MNPYIAYPICSCFYSILLIILFFTKKRIKTTENSIFSFVLIFNFFALIGELLCYIGVDIYNQNRLLSMLILKTYVVLLLIWVLIYNVYNMLITNKNYGKPGFDADKYVSKLIKYTYFFSIVLSIIMYIIPLYMYNDGVNKYTYGPEVYLLTGVMVLLIVIWIIRFFINFKNIRNKKSVPLIAFFVLITIAVILQSNNRSLLLITSVETFICILMYFTIENPDIKQLSEIIRYNELTEQTYMDKSNFLFEMTQEIREPIKDLKEQIDKLRLDSSNNRLNNEYKNIDNSIRQLDFIVNDVLNVSTLNTQKLKLINNRYSLKTLYEDIVSRVKPHINDEIEFRSHIPNILPFVYGDNIKLKQIIYSLIMNSVDKTKNGFIEFNIDIVEKYDIARVIFTIKDSGSGIPIEKINEILSITNEIDSNDIKLLEQDNFNIKLCQKVIKSLGGNLLIKSKLGKGTEVMLTIDQKIVKNEEKPINTYMNDLQIKNVLLVCQNKDLSQTIINKLKENNISSFHIMYGMDAVDNIKSGKKYDYIIVEDDMKQVSGYETLKQLKKEKKFHIPVIIMLNENKRSIKDEYIKDGFKDCIFIENLNEDLDRIINKY